MEKSTKGLLDKYLKISDEDEARRFLDDNPDPKLHALVKLRGELHSAFVEAVGSMRR